MSSATQVLAPPESRRIDDTRRESARAAASYLRRNPSLGIGLLLLVTLILFVTYWIKRAGYSRQLSADIFNET